MKPVVTSFFAGVGGIDLAFKQAGFDVAWANEIDPHASETYRLNFSSPLITEDIRNISPSDVPFTDVMVGGFPCQAFSIAGKREGFNDPRGGLFFEFLRIIKAKRPKVVFLENVKNLLTHNKGETLKTILSELESVGYTVKYKVMNACDYGDVPQNRDRIYLVCFRDRKQAEAFTFPEKIPLKRTIGDCLFPYVVDACFYYRKDNCNFYDDLKYEVTKKNTLYQWRRSYVRENRSYLCPTLTANMGCGGHNVPIALTDSGIRKLMPYECFQLMGFPKDFRLPSIARSHLYKQAGNSVVVPVVKRIAEQILKVMNPTPNMGESLWTETKL